VGARKPPRLDCGGCPSSGPDRIRSRAMTGRASCATGRTRRSSPPERSRARAATRRSRPPGR
jgi:hypothetical protein